MRNRMIGTAHWCGTYRGKPAVQLSYYGGADLWVFDRDGWIIQVHASNLSELSEIIGLPWNTADQPRHLKA